MSCNNPVFRHNSKGQLVATPCKYFCHGCRLARQLDFTQRFKMDFKEYNYIGSFITLTYRDSDLPQLFPLGSAIVGERFKGVYPPGVLYKPDLFKFFDNLNHKIKKRFGFPIRYIASGEYGDDGFRPHYHACILGLPYTERQLVYDTWNKGRVDIAPISNADIRYTLGYIDSEVKIPDELYRAWGDFLPEFGVYSKGLGTLHIKNNFDKYDKFGRFNLTPDGSKVYQLNDYYRKKFGFISPSNFDSELKKESDLKNIHYFSLQQHKNYLRERELIQSRRSKGVSINDTLSFIQEW